MAHLFSQFAHLGIASGVVGNRSVGISGKCDAESGEHTDGSDTNTIKSHGYTCGTHREVKTICEEITQHDGDRYRDHRNHRGNHSCADALYDDSGRTCL